jgi:hypothetical protein
MLQRLRRQTHLRGAIGQVVALALGDPGSWLELLQRDQEGHAMDGPRSVSRQLFRPGISAQRGG